MEIPFQEIEELRSVLDDVERFLAHGPARMNGPATIHPEVLWERVREARAILGELPTRMEEEAFARGRRHVAGGGDIRDCPFENDNGLARHWYRGTAVGLQDSLRGLEQAHAAVRSLARPSVPALPAVALVRNQADAFGGEDHPFGEELLVEGGPSGEEHAFQCGFDDYGLVDVCPYPETDPRAAAWQRGQEAAKAKTLDERNEMIEAGRLAYAAGTSLEDCPFTGWRQKRWIEGWIGAKTAPVEEDDEPLFLFQPIEDTEVQDAGEVVYPSPEEVKPFMESLSQAIERGDFGMEQAPYDRGVSDWEQYGLRAENPFPEDTPAFRDWKRGHFESQPW